MLDQNGSCSDEKKCALNTRSQVAKIIITNHMEETRIAVLTAELAVEVTANSICLDGNEHGASGCQFLV